MEATKVLYLKLTEGEIKSINGENKNQNGSSQTYLDIPKGSVSIEELKGFFGEITTDDNKKSYWKPKIYSLGFKDVCQQIEIYERRPGSISIRDQVSNRIKSWSGNGFPTSSNGYNQKDNPVVAYIIKDTKNNYWAGWFFLKEFTDEWFVNVNLAEIFYGDRAGIVDLNTPVYFKNNRQWPFVKNALSNIPATFTSEMRPKQVIIYGTPGSGKSRKVKRDYDEKYPDEQVIRTTFHPDTDYASFVGGYKPVPVIEGEGVGKVEKISYRFIPQSFTKAYVRAWNNPLKKYFLIIEEINRGNCAQIFGDIFQLLDRDENGYSEYPIDADTDMKNFLNGKNEEGIEILTNENGKKGIKGGKLCLPPNLNLIATMNTSDQSLFPMDTAFKRRWAWEYVPIDYNNDKSSKFIITIEGVPYKWNEFLQKINKKIKTLTDSEDKQMGNFFIKHDVDTTEFINKVMYYLWSEVGKDNYNTSTRLFECYKDNNKKKGKVDFSFNELFEEGGVEKLKNFMDIIKEEDNEESSDTDNEEYDKAETE